MNANFAVTDPDWLETLAETGASEVNFWQPRLESHRWVWVPLLLDEDAALRCLGNVRRSQRVDALRRNAEDNDVIGCVVLSDVVVLAQTEHVEAPKDCKQNTVRITGYDILTAERARVWNQLRAPESARCPCSKRHASSRLRSTRHTIYETAFRCAAISIAFTISGSLPSSPILRSG